MICCKMNFDWLISNNYHHPRHDKYDDYENDSLRCLEVKAHRLFSVSPAPYSANTSVLFNYFPNLSSFSSNKEVQDTGCVKAVLF